MEWGSSSNFIWLWLLPAAALIFASNVWRRRKTLARFGHPDMVAQLARSVHFFNRVLKKILILSALCLIVLALAQPHFKVKETLVERKGIDVLIAVDVSRSMLAKDIPPTRLDKAKLELSALVEKLRGNRVGIVAFAGEAIIQCPLTLDLNAVKLFISTANPDLISFQGTSLSQAIGVCQKAFTEKEKEHKALILLTDGENHQPQAEEAADRAAKAGIRIFTIGIGTPEGTILPAEFGAAGAKKDRQGQVVLSKLNETLLKDIARRTGGSYFRASRGELEVDRIVRAIQQMKQKGFKSDWSVEYEENYQFFVLAALILLLIEMWISERRKQS